MALFAADAADRPSYTRIPDVEVDEGPLVAFLLGQAVTQPQECQQMPAHNSFCIRCYLFQMFVECRSGCGKLQVCWTFSLVLWKWFRYNLHLETLIGSQRFCKFWAGLRCIWRFGGRNFCGQGLALGPCNGHERADSAMAEGGENSIASYFFVDVRIRPQTPTFSNAPMFFIGPGHGRSCLTTSNTPLQSSSWGEQYGVSLGKKFLQCIRSEVEFEESAWRVSQSFYSIAEYYI